MRFLIVLIVWLFMFANFLDWKSKLDNYLERMIMSIFSIVFLDEKRITVEAVGFSVAKVKAAYQRMEEGATKHTALTVDDSKSSKATIVQRDYPEFICVDSIKAGSASSKYYKIGEGQKDSVEYMRMDIALEHIEDSARTAIRVIRSKYI